MLFESQDDWSSASASDRTGIFESYANEIGLDKSSFSSVLETQSASINKKINFDTALGRKLNVDSTPTFYLNGKKLSEETVGSDEEFEKALKAEIAKQAAN